MRQGIREQPPACLWKRTTPHRVQSQIAAELAEVLGARFLSITKGRFDFEDATRGSPKHQGVEFPSGEVGMGKISPLTTNGCHALLLQPAAQRNDIRIKLRTAPALAVVAVKSLMQAFAKSEDIIARSE